jgi:hypothetical protein
MRLLTGKDRAYFEDVQQCRHQCETALRLREEQIDRLVTEIAFLRTEVSRERHRADNAIDELLAMRGIAPVSVPPEPRDLGDGDPFAEDPEEVAKIEQRMRDQGIGAVLMAEKG